MFRIIYDMLMFTTMLYRNRDIIHTFGKPILLCVLQNIDLKRIRYNIKVNLIQLSQRIQIMENYI